MYNNLPLFPKQPKLCKIFFWLGSLLVFDPTPT